MDDSEKSSQKIDFNEDYESEFEYDEEAAKKRRLRQDLAQFPIPTKIPKPNRQDFHDECSREQSRIERLNFHALDAYTRHKKLINEYVLCYPGSTSKLKRDTSNYKTDHDIIKEHHKFLWEDDDEVKTWDQKLAKKYYDRLFKEYCLVDLSRYKEKKIGMRWRTEKELILGKGQFFCGNVHCDEKLDLRSWEVNFGYVEHGQKKNALVKIRLCVDCSYKLHYGYKGKVALKERQAIIDDVETDVAGSSDSKKSGETVNEDQSTADKEESTSIWKKPVTKEDVEQSTEDAFESYLEDMFL